MRRFLSGQSACGAQGPKNWVPTRAGAKEAVMVVGARPGGVAGEEAAVAPGDEPTLRAGQRGAAVGKHGLSAGR